MNRATLEIKEIDYFHGFHAMRFTVEGEMVEKTLRIPVAQMCPDVGDEDEIEDHWLAHDMILIARRRGEYIHPAESMAKVIKHGFAPQSTRRDTRCRYVGPFCKAVLTLQRIWRTKPPSGRLLTKW